jgi:hypothetical protein
MQRHNQPKKHTDYEAELKREYKQLRLEDLQANLEEERARVRRYKERILLKV